MSSKSAVTHFTVIEPRLAKALSHPLRPAILAEMSRGPISPVQFTNLKPDERQLTGVAYHFRALAKLDFIEVLEEHRRRGAHEHVYGLVRRAVYGDIDWKELPVAVANSLNGTILRGINDRVLEAIEAETFDSRANNHFTWTMAKLDNQGFDRVMDKLYEAYEALREEEVEAAKRLSESGEEPVYTTVAIAGFESPKPKRDEKQPKKRRKRT